MVPGFPRGMPGLAGCPVRRRMRVAVPPLAVVSLPMPVVSLPMPVVSLAGTALSLAVALPALAVALLPGTGRVSMLPMGVRIAGPALAVRVTRRRGVWGGVLTGARRPMRQRPPW